LSFYEGICGKQNQRAKDFISTCIELGKEPDKEYKGSFKVKLKPKIHRLAAIKSAAQRMSLNQFVEKVLEMELAGTTL
jgi:predicted HicB family RNase H-like nuclease